MIRAWFAGVLAALFPPRRFWVVKPLGNRAERRQRTRKRTPGRCGL